MTQSEPLHWMRQQFLRGGKKPHRVRQARVKFKRSFIHPLRMDRENKRFAQRFKHVDPQATSLGARGFVNPEQLIPKFRLLSRQRLKADDEVKRQASPPANKYVTGKWREPSFAIVFSSVS